MNLGKEITIINKKKNHLLMSLSIFIITLVVSSSFFKLHLNKTLDFTIGKDQFFVIFGLLTLTISSTLVTYINWPKYSYVLYRKGIKAINNNNEIFIPFEDIEEFIVFPQVATIGLSLVAIAFKTSDSPWMLVGPGHRKNHIYKVKEAYENYIYSIYLSKLKNQETLKFKYINNTQIKNQRLTTKKTFNNILKILDNNSHSILLNEKNIIINDKSYKLNKILKIIGPSIDNNKIIYEEENNSILDFNLYSISKEDIFKVILKQYIEKDNETYL